MNEQIVDLLCIRETHQADIDANPVVVMQTGALLLCPRGEAFGHVWRAAAGFAYPDDPRLRLEIVGQGAMRVLLPSGN